MPRYTKSYSSFVKKLDEVYILIRMAFTKERQNPIAFRQEINALCRGAIVILSSHLESFVEEIGEIALDSLFQKNIPRNLLSNNLFYHISKDLIDEIKETSDPDKITNKIFFFLSRDSLYWDRSGYFHQPIPSDRFNKSFSNPTHSKVKSYFNRFGFSELDNCIARKLKAKYQPTINMVDHLVDIRNKIAHGDFGVTKTPMDMGEIVSIIKIYCATIDYVFASWWKKNYCSIR